MELVYLTAYQGTTLDPAIDRKVESMRLTEALHTSLGTSTHSARIDVQFIPTQLSAKIYVADANHAFALIEPVFRASAFCREGCVLIRYGEPGAVERQINL